MMSREQQKRGKQEKGSDGAEKVIVAVKASKEIPKTALVWSLTHVVQPGDCITLLVVVPSQSTGRRLWGFPRFAGDCANGQKKSTSGSSSSEHKSDITDSCSQMILQLHDVYDPNKLKHEEKQCMEELQCNIVVMKHSQPKVLRLNLVGTQKKDFEELCPLPSEQIEMPGKQTKKKHDSLNSIKGPVVTPTSSPELGTPFTTIEAGTSSVSSSDQGTSPFFISEMNGGGESKKEETIIENPELDDSISDTDSENLSTSSASLRFQPWITDLLLHQRSSQPKEERTERSYNKLQSSTARALLEKFSRLDREAEIELSTYKTDFNFSGNVGDFGLARWQPDGDTGVETRVIGTFGYLAPEYAQSGQITEKADVYSFGVVLVELVTGRKAVDLNRPKGQQCLTEWARPLLEEYAIEELIDPRLGSHYSEHEVYCMLHAASLCIRRDPYSRPRMSQVLRILEGDTVMDPNYISTPSYDVGNRGG
ncbi:hypothetical protein JHK84_041439 [Glycine max]|nr:hypothetical protein JHK84_041439 [Glycine max]